MMVEISRERKKELLRHARQCFHEVRPINPAEVNMLREELLWLMETLQHLVEFYLGDEVEEAEAGG